MLSEGKLKDLIYCCNLFDDNFSNFMSSDLMVRAYKFYNLPENEFVESHTCHDIPFH